MDGFDPSTYRDGFLDELKLDAFEIKTPSGRVLCPHAGQSVWLLAYGLSMDEELKVAEFADLARETGEGAAADKKAALDAAFDGVCQMMGHVVMGWNITDPHGVAYPPPFENPAALRAIPSALFKYLLDMFRGTEPEEKEGGGSAA